MVFREESGADFDDLAFENFQRLLDQRVVLEIVFVERRAAGFSLRRLGGRGGLGGVAAEALPERPGRRRSFGSCRTRCRRLGLDEFDLAFGMAQFGQFGLQQRVVARVVHQRRGDPQIRGRSRWSAHSSRTKPDARPPGKLRVNGLARPTASTSFAQSSGQIGGGGEDSPRSRRAGRRMPGAALLAACRRAGAAGWARWRRAGWRWPRQGQADARPLRRAIAAVVSKRESMADGVARFDGLEQARLPPGFSSTRRRAGAVRRRPALPGCA